jgi:hypothetical protein
MEYRVKQGNNLSCEYTGEPAMVLIQLVDSSGNASSWLSGKALEGALKLVDVLEGNPTSYARPKTTALAVDGHTYVAEMTAPEVAVQQSTFQPNPSTNRPRPKFNPDRTSAADNRTIESFDEDCAELVENPPPDAKGQQNGVHESHIRELIGKYKTRVSNSKALFPVVNKHFGMAKERFDLLIEL